jgi:DNA polymerase-3 subunit gamma/tau
VAKALGPDALHLPSDQAQRLTAVGATASAGTLSRVWSMLLKAHEEVRRAPDPFAAVEMALIRLCYAADLPGPEEALKRLQSGEIGLAQGSSPALPAGPGGGGGARATAGGAPATSAALAQPSLRPVPTTDAQAVLQSFDDVMRLIESKRDALLKVDVDRFVRLVDFKPGQITFAPAPGAPANLTQRLSNRLKEWTGQPWRMVIEGGGGAETVHEREQRAAQAFRAEAESDPTVQALLAAFPGAEVIGVRRRAQPTADTAAPVEPDEDDDA